MNHTRRQLLSCVVAGVAGSFLSGTVLAGTNPRQASIAAAWRGPEKDAPYFAGTLLADWEARTLTIRQTIPLRSRPHGLIPEAEGGMLIVAARPGRWLMRCDGHGTPIQEEVLDDALSTRFCGHAIIDASGKKLFTTETDHRLGVGVIGVRDLRTLQKIDEWETHGIDPHQLTLDAQGHVIVANGGVPRTLSDMKHNLQRMDSSLVRLDAKTGKLLRQWRLDDPRLSLRHLAWSHAPAYGAYLGIALQAEHDQAAERAQAPILAILYEERLFIPTRANDGVGYAGDIAAAWNGGFVLSSNQAGLAQLWHPSSPDRIIPIVKMEESYALTSWPGGVPGGGVLVATALGLVRSHPSHKPIILPWPQPMALDNHWSLMGEA